MDERSRSIEVSARSVEEAILRALQQLGLRRDEVEVEVLKQGSRGLLGLLGEESVVRVTPKVPLPTPAPGVEAAREAEKVAPPPPAEDQEETARLGTEVLQKLLDYMGIQGRVRREPGSRPAEQDAFATEMGAASTLLNIHSAVPSGAGSPSESLGLLIGRRGETLRDLQFLTCLIVSRHTQHWPNLVVDVEHYKARREKSLVELARRMAERVRTTAQPVSLEPMPAYERRIVHLALRDDPDVRTESTGQGEKRKVVIMPK